MKVVCCWPWHVMAWGWLGRALGLVLARPSHYQAQARPGQEQAKPGQAGHTNSQKNPPPFTHQFACKFVIKNQCFLQFGTNCPQLGFLPPPKAKPSQAKPSQARPSQARQALARPAWAGFGLGWVWLGVAQVCICSHIGFISSLWDLLWEWCCTFWSERYKN